MPKGTRVFDELIRSEVGSVKIEEKKRANREEASVISLLETRGRRDFQM